MNYEREGHAEHEVFGRMMLHHCEHVQYNTIQSYIRTQKLTDKLISLFTVVENCAAAANSAFV